MRKSIFVFFLFVLGLLHGCTKVESIKLNAPVNVRVESSSLKWNPVDYASKYQIQIGNDVYESITTIYDLSYLSPIASVSISVKAIGDGEKYLNSDWSNPITHSVDEPLSNPTKLDKVQILGLYNNILTWTPVDDASSYEIDIIDIKLTSETTSIDVSALFNQNRNNCYVRVRAIPEIDSNFEASNWSDIMIFNYDFATGNAVSDTPIDTGVITQYEKVDRYVAQQVEGEIQFDYSITYEDDYDYYYFYLGNILSTPIFTSTAKQYDFDGEFSVRIGKATEETISNTVSTSLETITTATYTGGYSVSNEFGVEIGSNYGKVSNKFTITKDYHYTGSLSNNITRSNQNTKVYTTILNEEYEIKYLFSEKAGFKKGYSYRETLFETVDVYAVVVYDRDKGTYSYELIPFIRGNNNRTFVTEESDQYGSFRNPTTDDVMKFDINKAIELIATYQNTDSIVYSDETDASHVLGFDGGNGSIEKPYIIGGVWKPSHEQFLLIQNHLSSHFTLRTDVDMSSYSGSFNSVIKGQFTGSLSGNNHTIKGLNLDLNYQTIRPNEANGFKYQIALFEHLGTSENTLNSDSIIKDLVIDNFKIYFSPYHDKPSELYSFGLLVANGNGVIKNVTIKNSHLESLRAQARSGMVAGVFKGEITNTKVLDSLFKTNGDGGGIVGTNYGIIKNCLVERTIFSYYFQYYDGVPYETSFGGIVGTLRNLDNLIGTIDSTSIKDSSFAIRNNSNYGWFNQKSYNPRLGFIVGHAIEGRIYQVGKDDKCTVELTHGAKGDSYFAVGWGYAGKIGSKVDVK